MVNAQEFFGKEVVSLFHGSSAQVKHPQRGVGNPHNDYGPGFYTTELRELALEWACPSIVDGWANEYALDTHGLSVVDLSGPEFTVLNWMAVLLEHRKINVGVGIAGEARGFIIENYGVDLSSADIVHGYRADDSYFHIARSFLNNRIPVEVLEQSLFLGGLGHQVAVVSEAASAPSPPEEKPGIRAAPSATPTPALSPCSSRLIRNRQNRVATSSTS